MMQRKEIGLEVLLLNNFNLRRLLCSDWTVPGQFPAPMSRPVSLTSLRRQLPTWLLAVCIERRAAHAGRKNSL